MIQSRFECLLMSDDTFRVVAIRLIAIALTVRDTPAADEQHKVKKRLELHFILIFIKSLKKSFFFSTAWNVLFVFRSCSVKCVKIVI